ncbi:MAG: TlpA family protein disulfide reductase [Kofleriaceae bacterium]|nr:TlpA family protein disulfide reductase [Myxococcales bacterium]MCB9560070.1 TlpA family protein disulfide reductase [Kofleriaceae bacterium]MCB9571877.1 TlpA family protein disulfide reductase [Kofleriaceae bacterium]
MAPARPRPRGVLVAAGAAALLAIGVIALVLVRGGGRAAHRVHTERPPAPAIALTGLDGAPIDLAALRGKVVVVDFWATWCEPCRDEIPQLIALQRELGPRGVQLVGISMDDTIDDVRAFDRDVHLNYPVGLGDAALGERFGGVLGLPAKFLIDRDGRIADRRVGPVDTAELARALRALLAE